MARKAREIRRLRTIEAMELTSWVRVKAMRE